MRLLLCLTLALCAGCALATGAPAHLCGAAPPDERDADAADPGPFAFVCWSARDDSGVHCFVGPDARAACLADPERPSSAPCE